MTSKGKAVAYGSLYLDEEEDWEKVIVQLNAIIQPNVVALFFDVVGWPHQKNNGDQMARRITNYVNKEYPNLDKVLVGFTNNSKGDMPRV